MQNYCLTHIRISHMIYSNIPYDIFGIDMVPVWLYNMEARNAIQTSLIIRLEIRLSKEKSIGYLS